MFARRTEDNINQAAIRVGLMAEAITGLIHELQAGRMIEVGLDADGNVSAIRLSQSSEAKNIP